MKTGTNLSNILVVNDDAHLLELLAVLLRKAGYAVTRAQNGRQALELALQSVPELVLSDVVMPVMDGIELCRRLRENPPTAHVPVLLLSGMRSEESDVLAGLASGADDYVELPFRKLELLAKIARLVDSHKTERYYRETVEFAPDIIFTGNIDGIVTSMNEAGIRFFGKPIGEIESLRLEELIGKEQADENIARARSCGADSQFRWDAWIDDAAGVRHCLEGISTIVGDKAGQPETVRCVVRDITERKLAEEAVRQSEERHRQMFEGNRAIKLIVDPKTGEIVEANAAAAEFYGYSREELRKKYVSDINTLRPEEIAVELAKAEAQTCNFFLFKHRLATGEVRFVEINSSPMVDNGRVLLFSIINDVTERKKAEEALRESEARYRELFENANDIIYTHDLEGNFTSLNRTG